MTARPSPPLAMAASTRIAGCAPGTVRTDALRGTAAAAQIAKRGPATAVRGRAPPPVARDGQGALRGDAAPGGAVAGTTCPSSPVAMATATRTAGGAPSGGQPTLSRGFAASCRAAGGAPPPSPRAAGTARPSASGRLMFAPRPLRRCKGRRAYHRRALGAPQALAVTAAGFSVKTHRSKSLRNYSCDKSFSFDFSFSRSLALVSWSISCALSSLSLYARSVCSSDAPPSTPLSFPPLSLYISVHLLTHSIRIT